MIKQLTKLANHLDAKGLRKEADYLDGVIGKIAQANPPAQDVKIVLIKLAASEYFGTFRADITLVDDRGVVNRHDGVTDPKTFQGKKEVQLPKAKEAFDATIAKYPNVRVVTEIQPPITPADFGL